MVGDTTIDRQIRHSITQAVECMDTRLLKRILYEIECVELEIFSK